MRRVASEVSSVRTWSRRTVRRGHEPPGSSNGLPTRGCREIEPPILQYALDGRLAELENTDAEPWHLVLRERASGERALLCAVLADAVRCLTRTIGGQPKDQARLAIQARRWVMKRGEDWPYSFENVCAALGLHPRLVRRRLLSLAREFERGR